MKPTPPQLSGLPILGNLLEFTGNRRNMVLRGYEQFGDIYTVRLIVQNVAVLFGEEATRTFFEKTDQELRMDKAYGMLRALFGDIAFVAPPEVYRRDRPVLYTPFKGSKMGGYFTIMTEEVLRWLDTLGERGQIDLSVAVMPLVQNIAAHALLGREFRDRMGRDFWLAYADLGKALDPITPPWLPLPKFIRRDRAKKKIRAMILEIVKERRASTEEQPDMLNEFLNARYDDGQPVDDDHIVSLIMGLMFAGHETTLGQSVWTLAELLMHPDYLATVQAEVDAHIPTSGTISHRAFSGLPHLDWAVQETTRLHPSADTIFRYVEEEVEIGNYRIPKGWLVMMASDVNQRLPGIFSENDRFDPERFSPERAEDKANKYTISGFGGGVHKCVGMSFANLEMSVIAALILRHLDLELLTPDPQTTYALGAARPSEVLVRYKRRQFALAPAVIETVPIPAG